MKVENKHIGLITAIVTALIIHLLSLIDSYQEITGNTVFLLFSLIVFGLMGFAIGNILTPKNTLKMRSKQKYNKKNEEINIYGDIK